MTDLNEARIRQQSNVNTVRVKQGATIKVTPNPTFIGTANSDNQNKYIQNNQVAWTPNRTVGEAVTDTLVKMDEGVNRGVNAFVDGVTHLGRNTVNTAANIVHAPVNTIRGVMNGQSIDDAIVNSLTRQFLPSSKALQDGFREYIPLVSAEEYENAKQEAYSDKLKHQENQLNKVTNTGSEIQDLQNTLNHYKNNLSHLGVNAVGELADMGATALMGGGFTKAVGLSNKVSSALLGEGVSSYGSTISELNNRGVDTDSAKAIATASSVAGVNMLTQKVLNTKYSPENIADNLLKSTASNVGKFGKPTSYVGGVVIGAGSEALEEALQASYETGAINYASDMPITQGMGRAVGEGVAIGGTLGGVSSAIGGLNEPLPIKEDNSKPNLGKLFTQAQAINKQKTQKINDVASQYNISITSTSNKINKENPIQVAIMGDYSKKDTGKGTNDHYDLRLARDANGKRGDINPYLDRFIVNGKPLNSYKQTGKYMEQRTGYKHEGVDYGFDGSFGKDANARNLFINPKYEVTNITAFDNNKHGGGWVTQVTFSDGIKVNILHQNKEGALAVVNAFKQGKSVVNNQYTKYKNLNLGLHLMML